jgi:uncharacterized protein YceK
MRIVGWIALLMVGAVSLSGCSAVTVEDYADNAPVLQP